MVLLRQFYLCMTSDLWIHLMIFLNRKCRIDNNLVLVRTHTCSDSGSEIKNQANSTPSFNFLATGGRRLITEIKKPNIN